MVGRRPVGGGHRPVLRADPARRRLAGGQPDVPGAALHGGGGLLPVRRAAGAAGAGGHGSGGDGGCSGGAAKMTATSEDYWVFAYGSLIWNPEFPYVDKAPALLRGYHRSFCLYSWHYRGTRD